MQNATNPAINPTAPGNNRMKVEHLWTMRGQARPDLAALHVYFMAEAGYLDAVLGLATA